MRQLVLIAIALCFMLSARTSCAALSSDFTFETDNCVAPCAIWFDTRTIDSDTTKTKRAEFTDITYEWEFGDPDSGNWSYGALANAGFASPKNEDTGPVAAHLYEKCGTYHVRLRVSDGSETVSTTKMVTITCPEDQWSTADTWCVSADAGHTGCDGDNTVVNSDFDAAIDSTGIETNCDRRVLFERGDTFDVSAVSIITGPCTAPRLIGAYGSGARPIVDTTAADPDVFDIRDVTDLRIMDLDLRGNDVDNQRGFLGTSGNGWDRVLLLRNRCQDLETCISNNNAQMDFHNDMHEEVAIFENEDTSNPDFGGSYSCFCMGNKVMIMGNEFVDDDGNEHVIRNIYLNGAVMSHNTLGLKTPPAAGCGNIRHVFKTLARYAQVTEPDPPGEPDLTDPNDGHSREFIIGDNLMYACENNSWQLAIQAEDTGATADDEHLYSYIVENNHMVFKNNSNSGWRGYYVTGEDFVLRNNVCDASMDSGDGGTNQCFSLGDRRLGTQNFPEENGQVYHNTCFVDSTTTTATVECVEIDGTRSNDIVRNNYAYDEATGGFTMIDDSGTGTTAPANQNLLTTTLPFIADPPSPSNIDDFRLIASASAVDDANAQSLASQVPHSAGRWCRYNSDGTDLRGTQPDFGAWEFNGQVETECPLDTPVVTADSNFTIIVLPDTQHMSRAAPEQYRSMTNWIASEQTARNIQMVIHVGDIVDDANDPLTHPQEWLNADEAQDILDNAGVPNAVLPGNHDMKNNTLRWFDAFNFYFPSSRYSSQADWLDDEPNGTMRSSAFLFSAGGDDYILINVEGDFGGTNQPDAWINAHLTTYASRRAIIATHSYLLPDGSPPAIDSTDLDTDVILPSSNVRFVLSGHFTDSNNHASRRTDTNASGDTIHTLFANYQNVPTGIGPGDGWLRIMEFRPTEDKVYVSTYSPYLDSSTFNDPNNLFTLDYEMTGTQPPNLQGIDVQGVTISEAPE